MHQVVSAYNYFFWVKCHPSRTFPPQRSLSRNPKIDSFFLPTTRLHPLNTLTCGPPPMYWPGTSIWSLGPLCMLHFVWICFFLVFTPFLLFLCLFDFVVRSSWCLSLVAWRMRGLLGSYSLPFIPSLDWALLGQRPSSYSRAHLCQWAFWLLVLPYHFIMPVIALPSLLLCVTSWTCGLMFLLCQPISLSILYFGLLRPTFHIFTSFGLCWPTFLLCQPISLFHPSDFLGSLLPLYLFYSHGLFTRSFRLPQPYPYLLLLFRFIGL